jgi:methanogen homocitrate synthase
MANLARNRWTNENWVSSPSNFEQATLRQLDFPTRIQLYDVTCRDGEQRPEVVFRKEDKIRIAKALDEVGIQRIEAGMPAVSNEDFEAVKEIAHLGLSTEVFASSRARRDDVDLALKCGVSSIMIEAPLKRRTHPDRFRLEEGTGA